MRRNNVVILPAKCQHTGKMYGIRAEKKNDGWHLNWAFELPEDEAARENFGEDTISGRIVIDAEYPGCPYCGGKDLSIVENVESYLVGMKRNYLSHATLYLMLFL